MIKRRILGGILIVAGILLILSKASGITGFSIIESMDRTTSSILGLALIIGGALILISKQQREWDRFRVRLVIREYNSGELSPVQAAFKINDELYPAGIEITGVDYRGGSTRETIKTREEYIPIRLDSVNKAKDLALAFYLVALTNDKENKKNCEIHLSKQASSKHHTAGLQKVIEGFERKYKKDLEATRGE